MKLGLEIRVKKRAIEGFGDRLTRIRKSRGITQAELGKAVGVSNRVIAYYEQDTAQPPGAILVDLARTLRVSTDELLGLKPLKEGTSRRTALLLKRLQKLENLPQADQRAVLKFVDALVETRAPHRGNGSRRNAQR